MSELFGRPPALLSPPPSYDFVVEKYNLDILKGGPDFVVGPGGLILTADGEARRRDSIQMALYRLIETWRFKQPHLQLIFGMIHVSQTWQDELTDKIRKVEDKRKAECDAGTFLKDSHDFIESFFDAIDQGKAAECGVITYTEWVIQFLSGLLLRFHDDLGANDRDWREVTPFFNGQSFGQIIMAAANEIQYSEERPYKNTLGLAHRSQYEEKIQVGSSVALEILSGGGNFGHLTESLFLYAHELAIRHQNKQM